MRTFTLLVLCSIAGTASAKVDLNQAVNRAELDRLSPSARTLASDNGFAAQASHEVQLSEVYKGLAKWGVPLFVTSDCALHAFHIAFDYALREAETQYFHKHLCDLTQALLDYETKALSKAKQRDIKEALTGNVAYLTVAASLLGVRVQVLKPVKGVVAEELALIDAHAGLARSPVMGIEEDYTQYVPRGHYTRSELLGRYFRAMMWYGRIGFVCRPGSEAADISLGRKLTRQALLLCDALRQAKVGEETARDVWTRVYETTTMLVGRSDDLNADDYSRLADELFGELEWPAGLKDTARLDEFIAGVMNLPSPLIVSQVVPDTEKPEQVTKGFRFMGQRHVPDSYMFQELVYTKVGTRDNPRLMPKGLDVMAVLGSDRALEILRKTYRDDRFLNYESQLARLREQFAGVSDEDWYRSIYFGWLRALKLQNESIPKSKLLPEFCFTTAYADKCLVTTCGSWAQLRHDTILYAKQSYTLALTAVPPREQAERVVYVEPKPEVFAMVQALVQKLSYELGRFGVLSEEMAARLDRLSQLVSTLQAVAQKEVGGQVPDPGEVEQLWQTGETLEELATFPSAEGSANDADRSIETVADVHTDPNTEEVLEVAVGKPLEILALVPYAGKWYVAAGAMLSYYEFTKPMAERMTDEKWQGLATKPPMPEWTNSFIAQ